MIELETPNNSVLALKVLYTENRRKVFLNLEKPWPKICSKGIPTTIKYPEISIPERVRAVSKKYPSKVAIVFKGIELSNPLILEYKIWYRY